MNMTSLVWVQFSPHVKKVRTTMRAMTRAIVPMRYYRRTMLLGRP